VQQSGGSEAVFCAEVKGSAEDAKAAEPWHPRAMTERIAACACGQVRVACQGEPSKVSLCHCLACQRRTGTPFSIAAFFPCDAVETSGETRVFRRPSDSGFDVSFHFCPTCGSNVWWEAHRKPESIGVAVGAFADPAFPAPSQAVYREHRHAWLDDGFD
jgi:hypothetical protein